MHLVAWTVTIALALLAALRLVAHDVVEPLVVLNTFTAYVYLPAYACAMWAVAKRRWRLGTVSSALIALHAGWLIGGVDAACRTAPEAPVVKVFVSNVMAWNTNTAGIEDEIARARPDIVAFQEYSLPWQAAFARERWMRELPYRIEEAHEDPTGTAILSRVPLVERDILRTRSMPIARATIETARGPVRVYSVHVRPPLPGYFDEWNGALAEVLAAVDAETLPVILAGDFNATQHSAWYARFARQSVSAAEDCGAPLSTSWPNGTRLIPPIRLDHVFLSRGLRCGGLRYGPGEGSDHKSVLVDVSG